MLTATREVPMHVLLSRKSSRSPSQYGQHHRLSRTSRNYSYAAFGAVKQVHSEGFEPPTLGSEDGYGIFCAHRSLFSAAIAKVCQNAVPKAISSSSARNGDPAAC